MGTAASQDEPDALVVFDGICNLCSASVRTIVAMDRRGAIRFAPVQSPCGRALCARAGVDPDSPSTFLFFESGRPRQRSDAVIALAGRLPLPWRALQLLAIVPRPLRDALYTFVARHRYALFGRKDRCLVPSPALAARFVEEVPPA